MARRHDGPELSALGIELVPFGLRIITNQAGEAAHKLVADDDSNKMIVEERKSSLLKT